MGGAAHLQALDALTPDTDHETIMSTVDGAVDEIIGRLEGAGGPPAPEIVQSTQLTLKYLKICAVSPEPNLSDKAKTRARELHKAIKAASKPAAANEDAAPEEQDEDSLEEQVASRFNEAFTNALVHYILRRVATFRLKREIPTTPFLFSPHFAKHLEKAMREVLVPSILEYRRVQLLAQTLRSDEMDDQVFFEIFDLPEKENVVRFVWSERLTSYRQALTSRARAQAAEKKQAEEDEGKNLVDKLKDRFLKKKDKKPAFVAAAGPDYSEEATAFWKILRRGAKKAGYDAMKPGDLVLLESLFGFSVQNTQNAKKAILQMLQQELTGDGGGRDGATRQYMCKIVRGYPDYCGEWIALWSYYTYTDFFNEKILKSFIASYGTSARQRKKSLPYFLRWAPDVIEQGGGED